MWQRKKKKFSQKDLKAPAKVPEIIEEKKKKKYKYKDKECLKCIDVLDCEGKPLEVKQCNRLRERKKDETEA